MITYVRSFSRFFCATFLLSLVSMANGAVVSANAIAESPAPPVYVASFNRVCSPDAEVASAVFRALRRIGDEPESLPGSWVQGECCGLADCSQKLQGRRASVIGGQIERTENGPTAHVWVLQPHQARVLVSRQTCDSCDKPEQVARMASLLVEQLSSRDAPWIGLANLPPCDSSSPPSRAPLADQTSTASTKIVGGSAGALPVLVSIRGDRVGLSAVRAIRGGLEAQLRQSGYQPARLTVPEKVEDPRNLLQGERAAWPVIDVELRKEANTPNASLEAVTLRLFQKDTVTQTALDCAMQDCTPQALPGLVRQAAGGLTDSISRRAAYPLVSPESAGPPVCLPKTVLAQAAPVSPPRPNPSVQPTAPPRPVTPTSLLTTSTLPVPPAPLASSPNIASSEPTTAPIPTPPDPPTAPVAHKSWLRGLGWTGLVLGVGSVGLGAALLAVHGQPADRTTYSNNNSQLSGGVFVGLGSAVLLSVPFLLGFGYRPMMSSQQASPPKQWISP